MSGRWRGRAFEPALRLGTVGGAEEWRTAVTQATAGAESAQPPLSKEERLREVLEFADATWRSEGPTP
jgi:hypothetical protein